MDELLKGSGVEHLLTGGLSKGVAFVRKAMAKTKLQNRGYRPPARAGYDFDEATRLDKPSKHIQLNIGRVAPDDVVKYQYNRNRKKSEEEKRREQVHKFEYWGLTKDDFEEIDGQLVEKKHGLIWGPIYYQPTGSERGVWGLRCCRYDKDGDKIPSNKKYEYLYVREDDPLNGEDISAVFPNPENEDLLENTKADPPEEITNEVEDEGEITLRKFYAKAKTNRFDVFLRKRAVVPFFWYEYDDEGYETKRRRELGIRPNTEYRLTLPTKKKMSYKDIPSIISAIRALRKFSKTTQNNKWWGSEARSNQIDRWDKHLGALKYRNRHIPGGRGAFNDEFRSFGDDEADGVKPVETNRYRDLSTKEKRDKYMLNLFRENQQLYADLQNANPNQRVKKLVRKGGIETGYKKVEGQRVIDVIKDKIQRNNELMASAGLNQYNPDVSFYRQQGIDWKTRKHTGLDGREYTSTGVFQSQSTNGNNRWGKARAEKARADNEYMLENQRNRIEAMETAINANEALIAFLVKNPSGRPPEEILEKIRREASWEGEGEIDRGDEKDFMKQARANLGEEEEE